MASLFGPSPAEILFARQKEQEQMQMLKNQQISQQGSQFGVFAPLYQAGLKFGDLGASAMRQGLFPQQADPALKEATDIQGVLSKYSGEDMTSATTLTKIGRELMSISPNAGIKALSLAKELQPKSILGQVDPSKLTPDSLKTIAASNNVADAEFIDETAKPSREWLAIAREKKLPIYGTFGKYTPEQVGLVNDTLLQQEIEKNKAKSSKVSVDVGSAMRESYATQEGKERSEAWAKAGDTYKLSVPLLVELEDASKAAQNAYFGFGAKGKIGLAKAFNAIGIPISERASDSEMLDALSSKLVQRIAKNFPGSQAIKELEQLIKSKPNLEQEAGTFIKLLNNVTKEFKAEVLAYEQLSAIPDKDRYQKDFNVVVADNYKKLNNYERLEAKIRNKTATLEEANEALAIKRSLGL